MSEYGVEYAVQRQTVPDGGWFHYLTCYDESEMYRVLAFEQSEERKRDQRCQHRFRGVKKRIEKIYSLGG